MIRLLPDFFCVEIARQRYAFFLFSPNLSRENRRNSDGVPPMRLKHRSVPSRASSLQECTTPYQAEHHHHMIVPLRTKQNNLTARLHYSVPLGSILQRSTFVPLVDVAAMFGCYTTLFHGEQKASQYPISTTKDLAPYDDNSLFHLLQRYNKYLPQHISIATET